MSDLDVIRELEKIASVKLSELEEIVYSSCGYTKNEHGKVTGVGLYRLKISDIAPLAELKQLSTLYLVDTQISDIAPLAKLKQLTDLSITFNQEST